MEYICATPFISAGPDSFGYILNFRNIKGVTGKHIWNLCNKWNGRNGIQQKME